METFITTALNLQMAFGEMVIFPKLILSIRGHGSSFHLLVSTPVSLGYFINYSDYRCLNQCSIAVKRHHDHGKSYKGKPLIGAGLQFQRLSSLLSW